MHLLIQRDSEMVYTVIEWICLRDLFYGPLDEIKLFWSEEVIIYSFSSPCVLV